MSDVVMRIVDLGKMYHIGGEREAYRTLRDTLVRAVKRPIERIRHPGAATHVSEDLWALRHIDLEVTSGEVLGVIGRNGSGKTTLLKVLSRITEPTEGRAEIRGAVASLLEVGTGFHPELTGRENIQLNGAILGMTRSEVSSRFDEIVEFSEISRFLDTPVKRYSSGMYVRLAFAVAAHLQPDVLVIDEVLAVGDSEFQKKCLGKMEQVATGGRTVLFVSHNMGAVRSLCTRCALLDEGRLVRVGQVDDVVDSYIEMGGTSGTVFALNRRDGQLPTTGVSVVEGRIVEVAQDEAALTSVRAEMDCLAHEDMAFNVEWRIATMTGEPVIFGAPELFRKEQLRSRSGAFTIEVDVLRVPLAAGRYRLELALTQAFRRVLDTIHLEFGVAACDPGQVGFDYHYGGNWAAMFADDDVHIADTTSRENLGTARRD